LTGEVMRHVASLVLAVLTISVSSAAAGPITTLPPDLAPGSTYFLVFVTRGETLATSSDISTYDAFVTEQANLNPELAALNTIWRAVGSTATVNAIDHVDITGPVYRVDGLQVATGESPFFGGGAGRLLNPVSIDQFGVEFQTQVFSGSTFDGYANLLSGSLGASPFVAYGHSGSDASDFLFHGRLDVLHAVRDLPMYAISGPLTAVPEPGTLLLIGGGIVAGGVRRYRRVRGSAN
jgi:hypothetical protein